MYEDANATLDLIEDLLNEEREQKTPPRRAEFVAADITPDTTLREIPAMCV